MHFLEILPSIFYPFILFISEKTMFPLIYQKKYKKHVTTIQVPILRALIKLKV